MNSLLILLPMLGAGLVTIGHVLGRQKAAAAPGTDAFAGAPGLPGHPLLNAVGGANLPAVQPAAPVVPSPVPMPSPLAAFGPLLSAAMPFIEQEAAALLGAWVKQAMASAAATGAAAK